MVPLQRQELVTDCSEIIKRLTQRMRARIALDRIVTNLEKSEMPLLAEGNETTSILNSSIHRSMTNLTTFRSWREISFDEISKWDHIQAILNENLIDRLTTSIYECKFQSITQDENNKTILYANVFIPANYPQARSFILLKLFSSINGNRTIERTRINSENIKVGFILSNEMERLIKHNDHIRFIFQVIERSLISDVVYSPMSSGGSGAIDPSQHFTLLAQQIWRLSISFPLLIDAESTSTCTYVFAIQIFIDFYLFSSSFFSLLK